MKYQITCDNCGTQFIVEAGEGQTIECKCPHCHGVMEVTLPLVSAGQQYEKEKKNSHAVAWGIVIGLLLLTIGVGAYIGFRSSGPKSTPTDSIPTDTIPYETPVDEPPAQVVDTVVEAPAKEKPKQEENTEEEPQEEQADTAAVTAHDE